METKVTKCKPNIVDEETTIIGLNNGSEAAFVAAYQRYHQQIYANILKIVHAPEYSEEILQDVFLSLWENRQHIDQHKSLASWLFVVSFNKSMDFLKKRLREYIDFVPGYDARYMDIEDVQERDELMEEKWRILEAAISQLSPRKKEVFRLYRFEGYSKERVAQTLNISINSVSEYLKQANKSIKQYVEGTQPYAYENGILLLVLASTL